MATWNLHLVGHDLEETIQAKVADFVASLESVGHQIDSAVLTSDTGQVDVPTTPVPPAPDTPPVQTPQDEVPTDTPPEPLAPAT